MKLSLNLPLMVRSGAKLAIFAVALVCSTTAFGQKPEKLATAKTRIINSTQAIKAIAELPAAQSIPPELIAKARVIAVFPNISKINILTVKAMKGSGLASRRTDDGWSTPVFYQFGMMDEGWTTVETKSPSVVMLFMSDELFKKDHIDIGNTVAGPVGESLTETQTKQLERAAIIGYGFGNGKLIGVKIEEGDSIQSNMGVDNGMNKPIFGKKGTEILWSPSPPAVLLSELQDLQAAIAALSKSR